MPLIERSATVTWEGNVARGEGRISADTGAFSALPFSLPTRIGAAEGKTSPEELLAAAHGGCLTMSLASELTQAGSPPERLEAHVTIRMDEVESRGHQIVGSSVTIAARVPGFDRSGWAATVERADESCPFSGLLRRAGADVSVDAELEQE